MLSIVIAMKICLVRGRAVEQAKLVVKTAAVVSGGEGRGRWRWRRWGGRADGGKAKAEVARQRCWRGDEGKAEEARVVAVRVAVALSTSITPAAWAREPPQSGKWERTHHICIYIPYVLLSRRCLFSHEN